MINKTVKISSDTGIHTRLGNKFALKARTFTCGVELEFNGKKANGKSLIKILSLGIKHGSDVKVIVDGEDEKEALDVLAELLATLQDA